MDSDVVVDQTRIYLIHPLRTYFKEQGTDAFVSGNSFLYYDPDLPPVGPDFYVVLGAKWTGQKKWVAWEESGSLPTTIIEFLSPSTEENDRGKKFLIYRDVFRTPEYFLVDQDTLYIEGYRYSKGHYLTMSPDSDGWFDIPSLGLQLGPLNGWIRLRTSQGELLLTGAERAEKERVRNSRLERKLRELGLDPDQI